ncbi:oleosin-B6-like [Homalodisca vitripennis]|uniref:oleosin-B6-like n=1 Tax=Homalodisca vitripennis TaxID=197043 RepID=UPI001EEC5E9A|nr:oleosin-B6-like [Homalodisca vitripennis]KAG8331415.1 hypothetical protein J6590_042182 [Homalodisca vitripennis]
MKVALVLCAVLAYARGAAIYPATHYVHTPQYDSAVIKSDRLGGNFAYSSVEAHAYAAVQPVVQNVLSPVGVSYTAHPVSYPVVPAIVPAYAPTVVASAPYAPFYPAAAPIAPIAPIIPGATPISEDAPAPEAPQAPEDSAPEAPEAPASDSIETASSDDSVTIEAA